MKLSERLSDYLRAYSHKDLDAIRAMFADDITLRDWKISVRGKQAAIAETQKNFESARSIAIETLHVFEAKDGVAAELRIVVDGTEELHVVDVLTFTSQGKIQSIRAYLGRGDQELA